MTVNLAKLTQLFICSVQVDLHLQFVERIKIEFSVQQTGLLCCAYWQPHSKSVQTRLQQRDEMPFPLNETLQRRCDEISFIYISDSFQLHVHSIQCSPYRKYKYMNSGIVRNILELYVCWGMACSLNFTIRRNLSLQTHPKIEQTQ